MAGRQVLIVDDVEDARAVLSEFLEMEGYVTRTAASGMEALERLKEAPADVVITDVRMPNMSGLELVQRIKEESPRTGVIVMTGYASIYFEQDLRQSGADDYVAKPFDLNTVKEKVERVLFQMDTMKPRED